MSILLILFGILILFTPPVDPDFGWHYKYGEYFFQHFAVLRENIFSYTLTDYKWNNTYWLSEVFLYFFHHTLGSIIAGIIFSVILAYILFWVLKDLAKFRFTLILVYIVEACYFITLLVTVRPAFFSAVFTLMLLEALLKKPKLKILFPLMFLLWANFHADFTIGLFIFGIYILDSGVTGLLRKNLRPTLADGLILVVSAAVTLVNPYGIGLWTTILNELTLPVVSYVAEWKPADVSTLIFELSLIPAAVFYVKNTGHRWYAFLVLFFLLFSFKAIYMARYSVVLAIPALVALVDYLTQKYEKQIKLQQMERLLLLMFLVIALFSFGRNIYDASGLQRWSEHWMYPYGAVQALKNQRLEGRLFNSYRWGGYLIWQLPEYRTFIDGRMTSWKTKEGYLMQDYINMTTKTLDNELLINKYFSDYEVEYVLDSPGSSLTAYLLINGWNVVYKDDYSILLQRKTVFAYR